jgi:hypothetical protein
MAAHVEGDLYRCPAPPVGCGLVKSSSDYYAAKAKSNGLSHKCKECARAHRRRGAQARPQPVAAPSLAADTRIARELLAEREEIYAELAAGARHVLTVLRKPPAPLTGAPIGDVLCATDGLDEAVVARILILAKVSWGLAVVLLTEEQANTICFQVKSLQPETWERWRSGLKKGRAGRPQRAPEVECTSCGEVWWPGSGPVEDDSLNCHCGGRGKFRVGAVA